MKMFRHPHSIKQEYGYFKMSSNYYSNSIGMLCAA